MVAAPVHFVPSPLGHESWVGVDASPKYEVGGGVDGLGASMAELGQS